MAKKEVAQGAVHNVPADLRKMLMGAPSVRTVWEDITPLSRNEWICWIESAKKAETRERRTRIMIDKFKKGERRLCCWAGCPHRRNL